MSKIFIIDDDVALCRSLEIQLAAEGHEAAWANTAAEGLAALTQYQPDLVLLDLVLPGASGLEILRALARRDPARPVAMITGQQDMQATIEAMRAGAFDYLRKPFDFEDLLLLIEKAHHVARAAAAQRDTLPVVPAAEATAESSREIVGADRRIVEVIKQIGLLSQSRITVLIEGESGTGKELVARALHDAATPQKPFVAVNCSAVVPTLPESEFFGHEKGAFTGAAERKIGKLEFAAAGTLFLDEIGDMSPELQAKMLRVLENREFERVGGLQSIPFKARVIAATHRDLEDMVRRGAFRQDLYYRLAVSRIPVPPLRERRGDIPLLVGYFLSRAAAALPPGRRVAAIEEDALRRLQLYDWPGNVRELQNVLSRAIALARGPVLTADDLAFMQAPQGPPEPADIVPLEQAERLHIEKALLATGWNITQTAKALRISPTTLRKKIADSHLRAPNPGPSSG